MSAADQIAALAAQIEAMQQETIRLLTRDEAMSAALVAMQGPSSLPDLVQQMNVATTAIAERAKPSMIDTRGLGKPTTFDNKEDSFQRWSAKFKSCVQVVYPDAKKYVDWCEEHDGEIGEGDAAAEFDTEDAVDRLQNFSRDAGTDLHGAFPADRRRGPRHRREPSEPDC